MKKTYTLGIRIPDEVKKKLEVYAEENERTLSWVGYKALLFYIKEKIEKDTK